jgi:hypothetical protein
VYTKPVSTSYSSHPDRSYSSHPSDKKKDEFEFTMVYLKLQNVGLSNDKKRRFRETPAMTLQGLQRLLMILGGKNAAEFRQIVLGVFTRYMAGTGPWSSWST